MREGVLKGGRGRVDGVEFDADTEGLGDGVSDAVDDVDDDSGTFFGSAAIFVISEVGIGG